MIFKDYCFVTNKSENNFSDSFLWFEEPARNHEDAWELVDHSQEL